MKDWTEIISEARDRNKEKAERQRRLKIAKTLLKGSALLNNLNKGKHSKKGYKKDSRYLDYLERRQKTREEIIADQRKKEEEKKKQDLIKQKEENLETSKQNIRSAIGGVKTHTIGAKEGGATATMKALGNLGSLAGGLAKAAIHTPGYLKAKRDLKTAKETEVTSNQPEKARERKKPGRPGAPSVTEEFSNWRQEFTEEFLFEIDELKNDRNVKTDKKSKVVNVMKGTNSEIVEINPNISEDHKEIASGQKKDDEGYMANVELDQMERAIKALRKKIKRADTQMPAWVQSKITRAADYIDTASDYLMSDESVDESYESETFRQHSRSELNLPSSSSSSTTKSFLKRMKELNMNQGKPKKKKKKKDMSEAVDKNAMKCNKPKAQAHGSGETGKSHIVKACEGGTEKIIRFGQLGVKGSPKKEGESKAYASRRHRFQTRHAKNIAKGKMSAAYWSNLVKW